MPSGIPEEIPNRFFEETCARDGRRNFVISPKKRLQIDLQQVSALIKAKGLQIKTSGIFGITFKKSDDITACVLKSGIMIAQTPPQMECDYKAQVFEIYRAILIDGLGFPPEIVGDIS
jgi:hypothetical protein